MVAACKNNTNVFSACTVRVVAAMFTVKVKLETTPILACPASRDTGDPRSWIDAFREAVKLLTGDKERSKEYGRPNEDFLRAVPCLITIQGQNRAAVLISALADQVGVSTARAGRFGDIDLFEGEDAATRNEELLGALNNSDVLIGTIVYNFLSYEQAAQKGRDTHASESGSRKPGLFAEVAKLRDLVRQVFAPEKRICEARVSELLGEGWKAKLIVNPGEVKSVTEKKEVLELQRKIATHVSQQLEKGLRSFSGKAYATLVYANALKNDHIIQVIMRRLLNEDEGSSKVNTEEGGEEKSGGGGKSCTQLPECLAQLFSLLETTQHDPKLCDMIQKNGLCNKVKTYALDLAREDLVGFLCESIATRKCMISRQDHEEGVAVALPEEGDGGVVAELPCLVTIECKELFMRNNGELVVERCGTLPGPGSVQLLFESVGSLFSNRPISF